MPSKDENEDSLPLSIQGEHEKKNNKDAFFCETPDGKKLPPLSSQPSDEDEDSFDPSIFSDANLLVRQPKSNIPSNFAILTENDFEAIQYGYRQAADKVKSFPFSPGVYLMKDGNERIIYIGKAKSLRKRASSYFRKDAIEDQRVGPLVREIRNIDYIETDSEVEALLLEARLIKDIQPKYNRDLKDDKTFPYIQITCREDFPKVEITRQPRASNTKLYGPFLNGRQLKNAIIVLQKIFKFRTCSLSISATSVQDKWNRPCILASIGQCSAPCAGRITMELYRRNLRRLQEFLSGDRQKILSEITDDMKQASKELNYELAAQYRDQLTALTSLRAKGELEEDVQPEVFPIDPRKGVVGLQKIFHLPSPPRIIEGIDIAHIQGESTVASLVCFVDGKPLKSGYRRYRIKTVGGIDDYSSIAEVVARRFSHSSSSAPFPDLLLIDGGKGQLHAALSVLESTACRPLLTISLAKQNEEIYVPYQDAPLRLSRHSFALRLLQSVRDESHRFAQHYHHLLRRKTILGDDFQSF